MNKTAIAVILIVLILSCLVMTNILKTEVMAKKVVTADKVVMAEKFENLLQYHYTYDMVGPTLEGPMHITQQECLQKCFDRTDCAGALTQPSDQSEDHVWCWVKGQSTLMHNAFCPEDPELNKCSTYLKVDQDVAQIVEPPKDIIPELPADETIQEESLAPAFVAALAPIPQPFSIDKPFKIKHPETGMYWKIDGSNIKLNSGTDIIFTKWTDGVWRNYEGHIALMNTIDGQVNGGQTLFKDPYNTAVYLRSFRGNNADYAFKIVSTPDNKWHIKHATGTYLGVSSDELKFVSDAEKIAWVFEQA